jgi:hypothetical protein
VPVIDGSLVSVAVKLCGPTWETPIEKVCVPLGNGLFGYPVEPEIVKCTVPEYPVAVLLVWSFAVTTSGKGEPIGAELGAVRTKWVPRNPATK